MSVFLALKLVHVLHVDSLQVSLLCRGNERRIHCNALAATFLRISRLVFQQILVISISRALNCTLIHALAMMAAYAHKLVTVKH